MRISGCNALITGSIANVFKNPDTWLEVSVNGTTVTPRQRLVSVPYSIRSGEADLPFIGRGTNTVVTRFEEIDTKPDAVRWDFSKASPVLVSVVLHS